MCLLQRFQALEMVAKVTVILCVCGRDGELFHFAVDMYLFQRFQALGMVTEATAMCMWERCYS